MEETILIRSISGTEEWDLVQARNIRDDLYEILFGDTYDEVNLGALFEFYPGDLIIANSNIFPTGEYNQAVQLVRAGIFPDRAYLDFKFKASINEIQISELSGVIYAEEIKRLEKEFQQGKLLYRGIRNTIEGLKRRNNQSVGYR